MGVAMSVWAPMDAVGATRHQRWPVFAGAQRAAQLEAEFDAIIADEILRADTACELTEAAFGDGALRTTGTAIAKVLPRASHFDPEGGHGAKKQRVIEKLGAYFERFFGLSSGGGD